MEKEQEAVDLTHLSLQEHEKIISVIKRDQQLRRNDEQRIFHLKAEIQRLRKRGVIKPGLDQNRVCARCLSELGLILNRGAFCPLCRKKVCKSCRFSDDEDKEEWVCIVCHKQIQLRAVSGDWMREFKRSASERIKSPSSNTISSATESISRSIKDSIRAGFISRKGSISCDRSGEDQDTERRRAELTPSSSVPVRSSRNFLPPKLPTIDCTSYHQRSPPLTCGASGASQASDGSQDTDDSAKLPSSPVLKTLHAALVLVNSEKSHQDGKKIIYRKVSNRIRDSSSSSEEEVQEHEKGTATKSNESTPSPRTPNSFKILSGINQNQATAFKFPPSTSPIRSRPSSYERNSERQSSDEFSTTMSSFRSRSRSRSTSSEIYDEPSTSASTGAALAPQPLPRTRRPSPLRKQRAIAEEGHGESLLPHETNGALDSGVSDCNCPTPPRNPRVKRCSSGTDMVNANNHSQDSMASLSETEEVASSGSVFRKVTVRRSGASSRQGSEQEAKENVMQSTSGSINQGTRVMPSQAGLITNFLPYPLSPFINDNTNQAKVPSHCPANMCASNRLHEHNANSEGFNTSLAVNLNLNVVEKMGEGEQGMGLRRGPNRAESSETSHVITNPSPDGPADGKASSAQSESSACTSTAPGEAAVPPTPESDRLFVKKSHLSPSSAAGAGSPAKRKIKKLGDRAKKLRDRIIACSTRSGGKAKGAPEGSGSSREAPLENYQQALEPTEEGPIDMSDSRCPHSEQQSPRGRSSSLPSLKEDLLLPDGEGSSSSNSFNWKSLSVDSKIWQEMEEDIMVTSSGDSESDLTVNNRKWMPESDEYRLVFMENGSGSDVCEDYADTKDLPEFRRKTRRILRVRSHLEISDGTAYIEDSDWEMSSDPGGTLPEPWNEDTSSLSREPSEQDEDAITVSQSTTTLISDSAAPDKEQRLISDNKGSDIRLRGETVAEAVPVAEAAVEAEECGHLSLSGFPGSQENARIETQSQSQSLSHLTLNVTDARNANNAANMILVDSDSDTSGGSLEFERGPHQGLVYETLSDCNPSACDLDRVAPSCLQSACVDSRGLSLVKACSFVGNKGCSQIVTLNTNRNDNHENCPTISSENFVEEEAILISRFKEAYPSNDQYNGCDTRLRASALTKATEMDELPEGGLEEETCKCFLQLDFDQNAEDEAELGRAKKTQRLREVCNKESETNERLSETRKQKEMTLMNKRCRCRREMRLGLELGLGLGLQVNLEKAAGPSPDLRRNGSNYGQRHEDRRETHPFSAPGRCPRPHHPPPPPPSTRGSQSILNHGVPRGEEEEEQEEEEEEEEVLVGKDTSSERDSNEEEEEERTALTDEQRRGGRREESRLSFQFEVNAGSPCPCPYPRVEDPAARRGEPQHLLSDENESTLADPADPADLSCCRWIQKGNFSLASREVWVDSAAGRSPSPLIPCDNKAPNGENVMLNTQFEPTPDRRVTQQVTLPSPSPANGAGGGGGEIGGGRAAGVESIKAYTYELGPRGEYTASPQPVAGGTEGAQMLTESLQLSLMQVENDSILGGDPAHVLPSRPAQWPVPMFGSPGQAYVGHSAASGEESCEQMDPEMSGDCEGKRGQKTGHETGVEPVAGAADAEDKKTVAVFCSSSGMSGTRFCNRSDAERGLSATQLFLKSTNELLECDAKEVTHHSLFSRSLQNRFEPHTQCSRNGSADAAFAGGSVSNVTSTSDGTSENSVSSSSSSSSVPSVSAGNQLSSPSSLAYSLRSALPAFADILAMKTLTEAREEITSETIYRQNLVGNAVAAIDVQEIAGPAEEGPEGRDTLPEEMEGEEEDEEDEARIASNLEKYYTFVLEEDQKSTQRRITHPYTQTFSLSDHLMDTSLESNVDEEEEEERILSDDSSLSSEASEDGIYSTPNYGHQPSAQSNQNYGNPLSYSLHTIIEESCEESERESQPESPLINKEASNDLENYFNFGLASGLPDKRHSFGDSDADTDYSEYSDSVSETSENALDTSDEMDPVTLASSRLEKYFTTGLLGSGAFNYPDDVEFADESDCDSIPKQGKVYAESKQPPINSTFSPPIKPFEDESYDTVKRRKKAENEAVEAAKHSLDQRTRVEEAAAQREQKEEQEQETLSETNNEMEKSADKDVDVDAEDGEKNEMEENIEPKEENEEKSLETQSEYRVNASLSSPTQRESEMSCKPNDNQVASEPNSHPQPLLEPREYAPSPGKSPDKEFVAFVSQFLSQLSLMRKTCDKSQTRDKEVSLKDTPFKALESQIAHLMETVSPSNLSGSGTGSTSSSTIGSNNSDYGSDTLESAECSSEEDTKLSKPAVIMKSDANIPETGGNYDTAVSEEAVYICQQLIGSLKNITEAGFGESNTKLIESINSGGDSDLTKAKSYIRDKIVALMHTVQSNSCHGSPARDRKRQRNGLTKSPHGSQHDSDQPCDSSDCGDSSPKISPKKTPSESGSETISASVSIPSYDDSDHTPTECDVSLEMDELFAVVNSQEKDVHGLGAKITCEDTASLKSWEARISLFAKVNAASEEEELRAEPQSIAPDHEPTLTSLSKNQQQEITVNGIGMGMDLGINRCLGLNNAIAFAVNSGVVGANGNSHKTVVKIDDMQTPEGLESMSPLFESLKDRSFSSDSVSSVQTVKTRVNLVTTSVSELSSDGAYSTSRLAIDEEEGDEDGRELDLTLGSSAVRKSLNAKEKASSENNLLLANLMAQTKTVVSSTKVTGTKSAGNISDLEASSHKSTFRDTGYYSFKSSEESIRSLEEKRINPSPSATSPSSHPLPLPHHSHGKVLPLPSPQTILEVDEELYLSKMPSKRRFLPAPSAAKCHSLSSSSIPDAVFSGSKTLPAKVRNRLVASSVSVPQRTRSSFFSTSGVLRKLALLREDNFKSSPRKLRHRLKSGNEAGVPQISVSDYSEQSFSYRGSSGEIESPSGGHRDDDVDRAFAYHSQTSLSSFGARSESMSSVYSAAGGGRYGAVTVTGEILFGLSYNYKAGALEVHIKECRNLAAVDTKRNRSNPYVKAYLLPDRTKSGKRKTKIKKHTLNPHFEEVLKFYLTISEIENRTLWLSVWHSDIFGRNDFLGEVSLPPASHQVFEKPELKWYPLQERIDGNDHNLNYKGDLFVALKYVPRDNRSAKMSSEGQLHILVKEAHNLIPTRANGTSDPFCKSYLLPDRSKNGKQKTMVAKKTCNPKWNHNFVYENITPSDLRGRCLELTLWDYDKLTSNDFLGGVRLSLGLGNYEGNSVDWMDSVGDEITLWQQMLDRPNMWVYGELRLRSSMQTRR